VVLSSAQARQLRELAFSSEAPSNGFQSVVDGFYDGRDSFCNIRFGMHRGLKADIALTLGTRPEQCPSRDLSVNALRS
jgi:hypothetical protein